MQCYLVHWLIILLIAWPMMRVQCGLPSVLGLSIYSLQRLRMSDYVMRCCVLRGDFYKYAKKNSSLSEMCQTVNFEKYCQ